MEKNIEELKKKHIGGNNLDNDFGSNPLTNHNNCTMICSTMLTILKMLTLLKREGVKKTRLTYNCAHLRLTKESLTVEFANKNV